MSTMHDSEDEPIRKNSHVAGILIKMILSTHKLYIFTRPVDCTMVVMGLCIEKHTMYIMISRE